MAMGAWSLCITNVRHIVEDAIVQLDEILFIEPCKTKEGRPRIASNYNGILD